LTRHYCTYFDQRYLLLGLTLHQSLLQQVGDFKLWILCCDDETYDLLNRLKLERVELIRLSELETPDLLAVKDSRSRVEYYWTLTPELPLHLFNRDASISEVAYVDADLYFFAPPDPIEQEFGNGSIMIVEHRYSPDLAFLCAESGIYNVGLLIFRRDANAFACLEWWRARCLEWCYARYEDGKMGDQKYLDEWPQRFAGVVVLQHLGSGVAPWNIKNYRISQHEGAVWIDDVPLVFYHFHQFKPLGPHQFDLAQRYHLPRRAIELIYRPYIRAVQAAIAQVQAVQPDFQTGYFGRDTFTELKRIIKRQWHIMRA
jgi:hypothetical protein